MNQTNATNDNDENNFIKILLNMIDNKFNDQVFTFEVENGCCSDVTGMIKSDYWSAISEASDLRMSQQRIIKTLKLAFWKKNSGVRKETSG